MQQPISFIRIIFLALCLLLATSYIIGQAPSDLYYVNIAIGAGIGVAIWGIMLSIDLLLRRFNLRALNTATIGLLCGYLLGGAIMLLVETVLEASKNEFSANAASGTRLIVYLFSTYLAMVVTARSSSEINASIPFIRFKQAAQKRKDLLIDAAALSDPRIIDFANSGLLDNALILPRFIIKECNEQLEHSEEAVRTKAKRCLDHIKKLEVTPGIDIRLADGEFTDLKEDSAKLIRLARLLDTNVLTADTSRNQPASVDGVRFINLHMLSTSLKPLVANGEFLNIKIQRYGKEPRQGVGYLEDGTMVVVNGGAGFIGETIKAQVLSAKNTSSGRMIFCNALDDIGFQEFALGQSSPGQLPLSDILSKELPIGQCSMPNSTPYHAEANLGEISSKTYFANRERQ
jgi:uncharacterized protein YacL